MKPQYTVLNHYVTCLLYRNVETKVSTVKAAIEAQGKMTPSLHISLSHAQTMAEVECLVCIN